MSRWIVTEPQDGLLAWARERLGGEGWPHDAVALGIYDDTIEDVRAVAVICRFDNRNAYFHFATDGSKKWATPGTIRGLFGIVFQHFRLRRITAFPPPHRIEAQITALRLGFEFEARMSSILPDGEDAILMRMSAENCRWIKERSNGR